MSAFSIGSGTGSGGRNESGGLSRVAIHGRATMMRPREATTAPRTIENEYPDRAPTANVSHDHAPRLSRGPRAADKVTCHMATRTRRKEICMEFAFLDAWLLDLRAAVERDI